MLFAADITGHGGLVALLAPSVYSVNGSLVHDGSEDSDTDVLYGGAAAYTLTTVVDGDGDLDLGAFAIPTGGESQALNPVDIQGSTTAGSIFLASSSSNAGATGPILSGRTVANGAQASQRGDVVLVSGGGVSRVAAGRSMPLPVPGAAAQPIHIGGLVSTDNRLIAMSNGNLSLGPAAAVSGASVDLSAAADFVKDPAATMGPGWVIYAPTPSHVTNGPDSGTTALWNRNAGSQPAGTITGPRYVFGESPTLTFAARSLAKEFGAALDLSGEYDVSGFQPGVPGLFLGDDATTAYSGTPALSSDGAAATSPAGQYPVAVGPGTLASAAGYVFALVPGSLTVNAGTVDPDTVDPVLTGVPANRSVTTSGNSAVVSWTDPTATDDRDASPDVACTPPSGSAFGLGDSTVTCTATDDAGNVDTETFTVTVTREATDPDVGMVHRAPIDAPPIVNVANRNAFVPVRVSLTGIGSPLVDDVDALALGAPTRVTCPRGARADAVETYTARWPQPTNLFFWDQRKGNWLAKFDTRTLTQRNACYRVAVLYGGTVAGANASGGEEIGFFYIRTR